MHLRAEGEFSTQSARLVRDLNFVVDDFGDFDDFDDNSGWCEICEHDFDDFDQNCLHHHDVDLRTKVDGAGSFEVSAAQMPPLYLVRLSSTLTSKTISISIKHQHKSFFASESLPTGHSDMDSIHLIWRIIYLLCCHLSLDHSSHQTLSHFDYFDQNLSDHSDPTHSDHFDPSLDFESCAHC